MHVEAAVASVAQVPLHPDEISADMMRMKSVRNIKDTAVAPGNGWE